MAPSFPDKTSNRDTLPVDASEQAGASNPLLEEFIHAATYTTIQVPAEGLTQLLTAGKLQAPCLISKPRETNFGTQEWHAQALGSGAGMVLTFLGTRKALKWGIGKTVSPELAPRYIAGLDKPTGLAATGFLMDSVLKPGATDDILRTRFINGTVGALSLYNMGRLSQAMTKRSLLLANTESLSFSRNLGIQTIAGSAGGLTHAQAESLLYGHGFAPLDKSLKSTYAGGLLGFSLSLGQRRSSTNLNRSANLNKPEAEPAASAKNTESPKIPELKDLKTDNSIPKENPIPDHSTNPWKFEQVKGAQAPARKTEINTRVNKATPEDIIIHKEFPNGGSFTVKKDGTVIDIAADGAQQISKPDGTRITITENGKTIANKDGSIVHISRDGTIAETLNNGLTVQRHNDGSTSTNFQNDSSTQNIPGLGRFTRKADGSYSLELLPDSPANPAQSSSKGTSIDYSADGLKTRETNTGELTIEGLNDGTTTLFPDGSWITKKTDGTQFVFIPKENVIEELAPDGTVRARHNMDQLNNSDKQEPPKKDPNEPWWKYFDPPN